MSSIILQCLSSRILRYAPSCVMEWSWQLLPPSDWEPSVWAHLNYGWSGPFWLSTARTRSSRWSCSRLADLAIGWFHSMGPADWIWDPQLGAVRWDGQEVWSGSSCDFEIESLKKNLAFVRGSASDGFGTKVSGQEVELLCAGPQNFRSVIRSGGPEKIPTRIGSYQRAKKLDCKCFLWYVCQLSWFIMGF